MTHIHIKKAKNWTLKSHKVTISIE
jgi:hypothetical protein